MKYYKYLRIQMKHNSEIIDLQSISINKELSNVTVNNVTYKKGMVIVADILDSGIQFEEIESIIIQNHKLFFVYYPYKIIGFNNHYFAYSVSITKNEIKKVEYNNLANTSPCLIVKKK